MYAQSLAVILKMLVLRAGPEDLPYSQDLTRAMIALGVVTAMLLMGVGAPFPVALLMTLFGIGATALFTYGILERRGLGNRFQQTFNAQLAIGSVFALALLPAFLVIVPELERIAADSALLERLRKQDGNVIRLPAWVGLYTDVVFIWSLVVNAHIVRSATGSGMLRSSLITVGLLFFTVFAISFAQALVS